MKRPSNSWVERINIDLDMCNRCHVCTEACFQDVIRWDENNNKPVAVFPEDCVWCLSCEVACPVDCIEVVPVIPMPAPNVY